MTPSRVLVVLPTYNERENVEGVVGGIREHGFDVLVVDDNSPDETGAIADRLATADPGVRVLHREGKLGLGSAYIAGFRDGLGRGYDFMLEMDADGSHLPRYLPALVEAARANDGVAIGSRYVPGGTIVGWGPHRTFLSWGANVYTHTLLGLQVRDCTSGFRCYARRVLEAIGLDGIAAQGYAFQIEMLYRCVRLGFAVTEIPIRFEDRVQGKSKVSQNEIRRALIAVPRLRFTRVAAQAARADTSTQNADSEA